MHLVLCFLILYSGGRGGGEGGWRGGGVGGRRGFIFSLLVADDPHIVVQHNYLSILVSRHF